MDWRKALKVATIVASVLTVLCALYIMINGLGLSDKYDFGAGAYYYADIPNFEKIINWDVYQATLPYWVYVALFLAWGALMYLLWIWVDRGRRRKK